MKLFYLLCIHVLSVVLIIGDVQSLYVNPEESTIIEKPVGVNDDAKLNMTIFYATQCPYSIKFFKEQLPKLFNDTDLYKYINFEVVPYIQEAKNEDGRWTYKCIHGVQECQYSKLHSCIINEFPSKKTANDFKKLVPFLICLMDTKHEVQVIPQCVQQYQVSDENLMKCLSNEDLVGKLMSNNLKKAKDSQPPVTQVPTILFDGVNNKEESTSAEYGIIKEVCKHFKTMPKLCKAVVNEDHYNFYDVLNVQILFG